jgi:hypothetical protein
MATGIPPGRHFSKKLRPHGKLRLEAPVSALKQSGPEFTLQIGSMVFSLRRFTSCFFH